MEAYEYNWIFTPLYMFKLQPIETVWAIVKNYVAYHYRPRRTVKMTRTHLLRGFYGTGVNSEEGATDSVNVEEALIAENDVTAFTTKIMATMAGWEGIGKKTMQGILRHITLKEANRLAKADSILQELGPVGEFRNPPNVVHGAGFSYRVEGNVIEVLDEDELGDFVDDEEKMDAHGL